MVQSRGGLRWHLQERFRLFILLLDLRQLKRCRTNSTIIEKSRWFNLLYYPGRLYPCGRFILHRRVWPQRVVVGSIWWVTLRSPFHLMSRRVQNWLMHLFGNILSITYVWAQVVTLSVFLESLFQIWWIIFHSASRRVVILLNPLDLLLYGPFSIDLQHVVLLLLGERMPNLPFIHEIKLIFDADELMGGLFFQFPLLVDSFIGLRVLNFN